MTAVSMRSRARKPHYARAICAPPLHSWLDVLIEPEEVGGIVFGLHVDKPFIVAAECGAHFARAFVAEEIHETGVARMRLERLREPSSPRNIRRTLRGVDPFRFDADTEAPVWVRKCGSRRIDLVHRAAENLHEHRVEVRRRLIALLDD